MSRTASDNERMREPPHAPADAAVRQRQGMLRWGRRFSAYYDAWTLFLSLGGYQKVIRAAIDALPGRGTILDVGCGTGAVLRLLPRHRPALHAIGCDLSPDILCRAASKGTRASLVAADSERIPFREKSLAGVLCLGVLGHLIESTPTILELSRVLKPAGVLVLWTRTDGFFSRLVAYAFERVNPGVRFRLCRSEGIRGDLGGAGIRLLLERRVAGGHLWVGMKD